MMIKFYNFFFPLKLSEAENDEKNKKQSVTSDSPATPKAPKSITKLKVSELRARLKTLQLDINGSKPVLVARLKGALESQKQQPLEPSTSKSIFLILA